MSRRSNITVQMQQVAASFTDIAGHWASRLASFLPSYGGRCTCVAPNPLVKGTSRKRAAPYVER